MVGNATEVNAAVELGHELGLSWVGRMVGLSMSQGVHPGGVWTKSSSLDEGQTGSGPDAFMVELSGFEGEIGRTNDVLGRPNVGLRDLGDEEN